MRPRLFTADSPEIGPVVGSQTMHTDKVGKRGFTLLELMIAMTILAMAMALVGGIFFTGVMAWKKGSKLADELHHGDFVMEQLVSALKSAAHFPTAPDKYGFRLEHESGRFPEDRFSWVKSGVAFMPEDNIFARGLHRIECAIEDNEEGEPSFAVRAYSYFAEDEDDVDADWWYISSHIKGLECRVYNMEDEGWDDEWEDTNNVPGLVEVSLFLEPLEAGEEPIVLKRAIQIPIGLVLTQAVIYGDTGSDNQGADNEP